MKDRDALIAGLLALIALVWLGLTPWSLALIVVATVLSLAALCHYSLKRIYHGRHNAKPARR